MNRSINRRDFVATGSVIACGLGVSQVSASHCAEEERKTSIPVQEGEKIQLLTPQTEGGMPFFEALAKRKTTRVFKREMLDLQTLSNLLWAAAGINRPDGRRTAPTALNSQEIFIFVILPNGVYCYQPAENSLLRCAEGNFQNLAGNQNYAKEVPVTFVYVADLNRSNCSPETQESYARVDCGFIGQNVYLFAAAAGLASVFRGSIDHKALAKLFKLGEKQMVLYAQSIGYPDEEKVQAAPSMLKLK